MAIRSKIFSTLTLVFAIGAFSVFATAQESTTTPENGAKAEKGDRKFGKRGGKFGRGMRGHHGGRGMGFLRGIELTDAQKVQAGAGPDVVRLSIGLEDKDDIIADLDQGLAAA